MEGRLLFKNCALVRPDGRARAGVSILVHEDRIVRVAPEEELPPLPGDWVVHCQGRWVLPGFVDSHAQLLDAAVLPVSGEPWLKDEATRHAMRERALQTLSSDELAVLYQAALARAALVGVTQVVEHARVPGRAEAALTAILGAAERTGLRVYASHANDQLEDLEANADFARKVRQHPKVRSGIGLLSARDASDALLRRAARVREELGVGAVFPLVEERGGVGQRILDRLEAQGLLGPGSIAQGAFHLTRSEAGRLARSRTLVAWNPAANSLLPPGDERLEALLAPGALVGVGSAGSAAWADVFPAALAWILRSAREGRLLDPDGAFAQVCISGPAELRTMVFGAPSGDVVEGGLADLVVLDEIPAVGNDEVRIPELCPVLGRARVAWTVVAGEVLIREGTPLKFSGPQLWTEERKARQSVQARLHS